MTKRSFRLEDPGAELLDRATALWDRYGRFASAAIGVIVAIAAISFFYMRARSGSEGRAAGRLAESELMFWQGYYPRSFEAAQMVAKQFPGTDSAIEAHRVAGDAAYWRGEAGDFKKAVAEYREYLKHKGSGVVADGVRRSLAYALESDEQYAEAGATYLALVGKFADRESSAEFLYAAARCFGRIGRRDDAARSLQRLLDEYGETSLAMRARLELAQLQAGSAPAQR